MKYTSEQKRQYFIALRERWKKSKELAEADQTAKALFNETGGKMSYWSFYFVLIQMQQLGMDGLPYIDCKTYRGWQEAGYQVRKGESSKIQGITWLEAIDKDEETKEETETYLFPKVYHLFHKSQVEPIGAN